MPHPWIGKIDDSETGDLEITDEFIEEYPAEAKMPMEAPETKFQGFGSFDLPYAGQFVEALRKRFPPELITEHIAKLPPNSRARLEQQFGKLPIRQQ